MSDDKRKSERHRVRFHLVYDDGASFNAGTVQDLSEGGLFLGTALPVDIGTQVKLTPLDDAGDTLFEVLAEVVRAVPYDPEHKDLDSFRAGMGLKFLMRDEEERTAVAEMIRSLEEQADAQTGTKDPFLGVVVPTPSPDTTE